MKRGTISKKQGAALGLNEDARKLINGVLHSENGRADDILRAANDNMPRGCGVEPLRGKYMGGYWGDTHALYVNTGDTYSATLLYDCHKERFYVTSWGDYVESHPSYFQED